MKIVKKPSYFHIFYFIIHSAAHDIQHIFSYANPPNCHILPPNMSCTWFPPILKDSRMREGMAQQVVIDRRP